MKKFDSFKNLEHFKGQILEDVEGSSPSLGGGVSDKGTKIAEKQRTRKKAKESEWLESRRVIHKTEQQELEKKRDERIALAREKNYYRPSEEYLEYKKQSAKKDPTETAQVLVADVEKNEVTPASSEKNKLSINELREKVKEKNAPYEALNEKLKKEGMANADLSKLLIEDIAAVVTTGTRFTHVEGKKTIHYTVRAIEKTADGNIFTLKGDGERVLKGDQKKLAELLASGYLSVVKPRQKKEKTRRAPNKKEPTAKVTDSVGLQEDQNISPTYEDLTEWHLNENGETETEVKERTVREDQEARALDAEQDSTLAWYGADYETAAHKKQDAEDLRAGKEPKWSKTKKENQTELDKRLAEIAAEDAKNFPGLSKDEIKERKQQIANGKLIQQKKEQIVTVISNTKKEKKNSALDMITIDVEAEEVDKEEQSEETPEEAEGKEGFAELRERATKGFDNARERTEHFEQKYKELFDNAYKKFTVLADSFLDIKMPAFLKEFKEQNEKNKEMFEKKFKMYRELNNETLERLEKLSTENLSENKMRSIGYAIDGLFEKIKDEDLKFMNLLGVINERIAGIPELKAAQKRPEEFVRLRDALMKSFKEAEHVEEFIVEFGDSGEIHDTVSPEMKLAIQKSAPMVEARNDFEKAVKDAEVKPEKRGIWENRFRNFFGVGDVSGMQRDGKRAQRVFAREIGKFKDLIVALEGRLANFKPSAELSKGELMRKDKLQSDINELKGMAAQEETNLRKMTAKLENYGKM